MIEAAYRQDALPVWIEDEAGPYQTLPYPGAHWQPLGLPICYPHDYVRRGTAKQLTLFHPASGTVRVKGVQRCIRGSKRNWRRSSRPCRGRRKHGVSRRTGVAGNAGRKG